MRYDYIYIFIYMTAYLYTSFYSISRSQLNSCQLSPPGECAYPVSASPSSFCSIISVQVHPRSPTCMNLSISHFPTSSASPSPSTYSSFSLPYLFPLRITLSLFHHPLYLALPSPPAYSSPPLTVSRSPICIILSLTY